MSRDPAPAVNDNLETAFLRLAESASDGATRRFGPVVASSSGLPIRFYNRVFVFETAPHDELAAAVAWMRERDLPYQVTVTEPTVDAVERLTDDLGLVKAGTLPGMAMPTLDNIPSTGSGATVTEITTRDGLDDFVTVAASVFETPVDVTGEIYEAALAADEDRLFLASVDGQPVGCGLLIQTGDVAGVYTIGVVDEFRRQGIGEATSWAVLRAGREAGCQIGVLQSSEMAAPLYREMGFETVVTYHQFEPTG